jgi:anti-sigma factor RsiW
MQCELVEKYLDAYVDQELDAGSLIQFESHLNECPSCQKRLALTRLIKAQVKERWAGITAPESLLHRVQTELANAPEEERRGLPRVAVVGMSAAAAVVFAVFGIYQALGGKLSYKSSVAESSLMLPIFEDVVNRHTQEQPVDVQDAEPDRIVLWFRSKVRFRVHLVDFREPSVHFVGARLSHVRERQAATFYYSVSGRRLTAVMFESPTPLSQGCERVVIGGHELYYRNVFGYTVPVIQHNNIAYAFTSDLDRGSLLRMVANARVP